MDTDLSDCRFLLKDVFKDASTLTKQTESENLSASATSGSLSVETSAQFGKFLESQSSEPLLPRNDTEED